MRKKVQLFIAIFIIIGGVFACSQSDEVPNEFNTNTNFYSQVGELHNRGVEYAFQYMMKNLPKTKGKQQCDADKLRNLGALGVEIFLEENHIEYMKTRAVSASENLSLLNKRQQKYYDLLISTILNRSLSYEATQTAIDKVAKKIQKNLTAEEADPLLYGVSVAKKSCEYWYKNLERWRIELGGTKAMLFTKSIPTTEETSDTDFSWKEVGKSDVSGAVGGAAGGAIVGSLAGGVGALPGAGVGAIGGSVAGSVGSAVEQVIDMVWPSRN